MPDLDLLKFHQNVICDKRAPRRDRRMLMLSEYTASLEPAPSAFSLPGIPDTTPTYWKNNLLGDCTKAAWCALVYSLSTAARAPFLYSDDQAQLMYERCDGYVPGDPSTDDGSDGLTTLKFLVKSGAYGHAPTAYMEIPLGRSDDLKLAARYFGGAYMGLMLPKAWQGEKVWDVSPQGNTSGVWAPGSWGGHMVYGKARYTPDYLEFLTWKETYQLTWPALAVYPDELFAVCLPDFHSPDGFNQTQLQNDLAAIR